MDCFNHVEIVHVRYNIPGKFFFSKFSWSGIDILSLRVQSYYIHEPNDSSDTFRMASKIKTESRISGMLASIQFDG